MKLYPDSKPLMSIIHPWYILGVNVYDGSTLESILNAVQKVVYQSMAVAWNEEENVYEGSNFHKAYALVEEIMMLVINTLK